MGRYSWSYRKTVESCIVLSIDSLNKKKCLYNGMEGTMTWSNNLGEVKNSIGISVVIYPDHQQPSFIGLRYVSTNSYSQEKTELDYTVGLETTPCNFGARRFWFICPLVSENKACKRRVAKLYLPSGGKYFGCRRCYNLTYKCQREHDKSVDAFIKNPYSLLRPNNRIDDIRTALLTMKAMRKLERKRKAF